MSITNRLSASAFLFVACSFASAQQHLPLKVLWEVKPWTANFMTTSNATERDIYPTNTRGAFMYVPASAVANTVPIYRLYNGADHMTSYINGEGGYMNEGVIGYAWNSSLAVPGISPMWRLVNPSTNDHAQVKSGDSIAGYSVTEIPGLYGYPRYNTASDDHLTLSAGGVTIKSNRVAGGAVWSWYAHGTEFINSDDYGRLLQSAIDWPENGQIKNPTEGGSTYSLQSMAAWARQGSPLLSAQNSGNTQTTKAIPLEWNPDLWGGGTAHPVIYPGMLIGKSLTLDHRSLGAVGKYDTTLTLATPLSAANMQTIAFLKSQFNYYYSFDAATGTRTQVTPAGGTSTKCGSVAYQPPSGRGGMILASGSGAGDLAFGLAATTAAAGGKMTGFYAYDCIVAGPNTTAVTAFRGASWPAGDSTFTVYVMSGTRADVEAKMTALKVAGDI